MGDVVVVGSPALVHRTQRRRLLPAFSPHGAAGDRDTIKAIVRKHVERWPRDTPFATLPLMRSLAFEVVVRHAIGLRAADLRELENRLKRLLNGPVRLALWAPRRSRALWLAGPRALLERRLSALDRALAEGEPSARDRTDDVLDALDAGEDRPPVPAGARRWSTPSARRVPAAGYPEAEASADA